MTNKLPFYNIFDALRKNGFPLGIAEYKILISVLSAQEFNNSGNLFTDRAEVLSICKTLWLKPNQVPLVFENIFNEQFNKITTPIPENSQPLNQSTADAAPVENNPATRDEKSNDQTITESADDDKPSAIEPEKKSVPHGLGVRLVLGTGAGQKMQGLKQEKNNAMFRRFLFSENYFPLGDREILQILSVLPERKQQKANREIDIDGTIRSIAAAGRLTELVYENEEDISNTLVILHDHKGSMEAFEKLSAMFTRAADALFKTKRILNNVSHAWYFQNFTERFIYLDKANTRFLELGAFLDLYTEKKVLFIIVSDAGAARGSNSDIRVRSTLRMLNRLRKSGNRIVWLNPMPEDRWVNTSAARIAAFVPMFPVERAGVQKAVNVLQGKQVNTVK